MTDSVAGKCSKFHYFSVSVKSSFRQKVMFDRELRMKGVVCVLSILQRGAAHMSMPSPYENITRTEPGLNRITIGICDNTHIIYQVTAGGGSRMCYYGHFTYVHTAYPEVRVAHCGYIR